ncbi:MAG: DNA recombination protein RmuC, partial [Pseudomonadota bacterium]|nr:DNA recombination protein RmuC [Pseudomonadota bacterium]
VDDRSKPDFVVNLPGNRKIVIDVKCSLDAYLGASEFEDDEPRRESLLQDHSRAIRKHAVSLGKRSYQDKFKGSAGFTVMFIAGENFLHAALQRDTKLIADAHSGNVIIVGPTNLMAMISTVAALRDQAKLNERAEKIGALGRRLYENLTTLGKNAQAVSRSMRSLMGNWNTLVGTLDGRWLSTARQFDTLGIGKGSLDVGELEMLDIDVHDTKKLPLVDHADYTGRAATHAQTQGLVANEDDAAA